MTEFAGYALGVDPGFASVGIARVYLQQGTHAAQLHVFRTERSDAKRKVLAADDNVRRARELVRALEPLFADVRVLCVESMSFPRNASAAAKMAMCWGILVSLAEQRSLPLVQVSPKELKKAVCGSAQASKEEVANALDLRWGAQFGPKLKAAGIPASQHEHAFDALGAVTACWDSDILRALRRP